MRNQPISQENAASSITGVVSYELLLDFTDRGASFASRARIQFHSERGSVAYADLQAVSIQRAELNGAVLDVGDAYVPGRLELPQLAAENTLIVEAEFGYVSEGAGLHRFTGPDGQDYVYSKAYPGGASRMYCCFDQAELRAPFAVTIKAPAGWSCLTNGPVASRPAYGEMGLWTFATTHPIPPYLSSFCAGPFSGPAFTWEPTRHHPLPVSAKGLPHVAAALEAAVKPELIRQPLAYYERTLGVDYPYGKCDLVFVPGYPGLAFGAPGIVTLKEQVLAESQSEQPSLFLASIFAHELAHAWFGGLVQFQPTGTGWLEEAVTTYISRAALEESHPGTSTWTGSVSKALPDHAYASNAARIRLLEKLIGRQAVLAGLRDLLHRHAHGSATKIDLVQCWSRAAGRDLYEWAAEKLIPAPTRNEES